MERSDITYPSELILDIFENIGRAIKCQGLNSQTALRAYDLCRSFRASINHLLI